MKNVNAIPLVMSLILCACGEGGDGGSDSLLGGSSGEGGSMAGMQILDGKLHILTNNYIRSFSLSSPLRPELIGNTWVIGAETLFNYQDKYLFAGTSTGIISYQLPETDNGDFDDYLLRINQFTHIRAYDPVIAVDGKAYFTTRNGVKGDWSGRNDYIGLLNIQNIDSPYLLAEYNELIEPAGLALRNEILYVCDKVDGLSLFTTEPEYIVPNDNGLRYTLVPLELNDFVACSDVIATDDRLILTSQEGIAQLRIDDGQVTQLSLLRNQ